MEARLILLDPPAARREVKLSLPATIGRSREAKIKLVHGQVSRVHCEFFERDGVLHVRDLGSTNGTYVGDDRVRESAVPPGETVTIGAVKFRAEYEPAEDAILPAVVLEATGTIRKAAEATFRAQAPEMPPATEAAFELEAPDQAHGEDTLANELALRSTAIPPVIPPTRDVHVVAPPAQVGPQPKSDAEAPRPVEWAELEELELAPLDEEPAAQSAETSDLAGQPTPDDSLHIFPPADESAAGQSPPELQWRATNPSEPAKSDDDGFEEFLRSLDDDKPA
jgi:pSer/pThr/pTyr-binding forkhead associated (FHA) protein